MEYSTVWNTKKYFKPCFKTTVNSCRSCNFALFCRYFSLFSFESGTGSTAGLDNDWWSQRCETLMWQLWFSLRQSPGWKVFMKHFPASWKTQKKTHVSVSVFYSFRSSAVWILDRKLINTFNLILTNRWPTESSYLQWCNTSWRSELRGQSNAPFRVNYHVWYTWRINMLNVNFKAGSSWTGTPPSPRSF